MPESDAAPTQQLPAAGASPPGGGAVPRDERVGPGPEVAQWADELSDRVIGGVDWFKSRTTVPVLKVLRAVVYGVVVLVAFLMAGILAVIGAVRIWDAYIPVHPLSRRVWLGYVVLGAVLFLGGSFLFARRSGARGKP